MQATRHSLAQMTIDLLPSRSINLGVIELNKPKALNALSMVMVRSMDDSLTSFQSDPTMRATLVQGRAGEARGGGPRPIFCAGGDVKSVYLSGREEKGDHGKGRRGLLTADFFREEYRLNHRIAAQDSDNMPQVSVWDGVVMGGGVGISIHGKYRVATEHTLFAMPETAIGLFPDVGGMYWMSRLPGGLGPYLALTGARLNATDCLYAGIATHYVPSDRINALQKSLVEATRYEGEIAPGGDCVAPVLMAFHQEMQQDRDGSVLSKNRQDIDAVFGSREADMNDIVAALEQMAASGSEFGKETLETLRKMSPTSLMVTLEGLRRGANLPNLAEVLKMEYRLSQGFMRNKDFYEGVRSVLVDKDHSPKWEPASLDAVSDDMVLSYFESLGENELEFSK